MRREALATVALVAAILLGCGDSTKPDGDGRILWSFQADAPIYYGSPALSADDSTVYLGTSTWYYGAADSDHAFYALTVATGKVKWRYPLGEAMVRSSAAVAPDGSVYFVTTGPDEIDGTINDHLVRLDARGRYLWSYDINPQVKGSPVGHSSPAVGPDGTVYVAGDVLYAINPDGSRKWKTLDNLGEDMRNSPVIGADGTVYFVYHNVPLTAFDPENGSVRWSTPLGVNDHCFASPSIGADGTIYVATNPGVLYAVSASGQILWTFDTRTVGYTGTMRSSPAVDADGTIYFGTNEGNPTPAFFALHPNGTVAWRFDPSDLPSDTPPDHFDIYSSPAIGSDGTIYFGQEFGRVYALDPADGSMRWMEPTHDGITWCSPALTADGVLVIADLSGRVFAMQTDSRGLKTSAPWPKFRRDARNSACRMGGG